MPVQCFFFFFFPGFLPCFQALFFRIYLTTTPLKQKMDVPMSIRYVCVGETTSFPVTNVLYLFEGRCSWLQLACKAFHHLHILGQFHRFPIRLP